VDFRTTRLYLAVLTVLLGMAGTLAYFGPKPASGEAMATASAAVHREHVESALGSLFRDANGSLPTGMRFVHTRCACGRDAHDWALIQVAPAEVPRIRKRIVRQYVNARSALRTSSIVKTDGAMLPFSDEDRPSWWTPSALPDPEVVGFDHFGGFLYVFSQSTGKIYVVRWTV